MDNRVFYSKKIDNTSVNKNLHYLKCLDERVIRKNLDKCFACFGFITLTEDKIKYFKNIYENHVDNNSNYREVEQLCFIKCSNLHKMNNLGYNVKAIKNNIYSEYFRDKYMILCLERTKNSYEWKLPGGKIKPYEDLIIGLYRELYEEIGIKTALDNISPKVINIHVITRDNDTEALNYFYAIEF